VKFSQLETIRALLKRTDSSAKDYLNSYLNTIEPLYPVLHGQPVTHEVEQVRAKSPSVNLSWLAQYLMVLGLGCFASSGNKEPSMDFYLAAEACLNQTPFSFRPNMYTLRTLCLMMIAKQAISTNCWAVDSCWALVGLIVRLSLTLGLHQDPCLPPSSGGPQVAEWQERRSLWTTILFLNTTSASVTGMPSLIRQDEVFGCKKNILSTFECQHPLGRGQGLLLDAFPTVLDILARANSNAEPLSYQMVLQYNTQVRQLMQRTNLNSEPLRGIGIKIFFRRALVILHRQFAHHPEASVLYPVSYWSSLECSLAILVHQRELADEEFASHRLDVFVGLFMLDFFSAALTACVHLLSQDAPLSAAVTSDCPIPPRQTILETLRTCTEIWANVEKQSICFKTGFRILQAALELIPTTSSP
jgi:hypothetical protein